MRLPPKVTRVTGVPRKPIVDRTKNPSEIVTVTNRDELKMFINDLKYSYDQLAGQYKNRSVFLFHTRGTLQVNVCLK